jgi:hypothetical protein
LKCHSYFASRRSSAGVAHPSHVIWCRQAQESQQINRAVGEHRDSQCRPYPATNAASSSRSGHRDGARTGAVAFYAGPAAASRNRSGLAAASRAGPDGGEDAGCGSTAIRGCGCRHHARLRAMRAPGMSRQRKSASCSGGAACRPGATRNTSLERLPPALQPAHSGFRATRAIYGEQPTSGPACTKGQQGSHGAPPRVSGRLHLELSAVG